MAAGRRGNNEGSIYQRKKDGRWAGVVTLPDGKRRYFYGKKREEVAAKLNEALRLKSQNRLNNAGGETVATYLESWYAGVVARKEVGASTLHNYRLSIGLMKPLIGKHRLSALNRKHVQGCYDKLSATYAPGTMRVYHTALTRALNDAVDLGLIMSSPAFHAKLPRKSRTPVQTLTAEQALRLCRIADGTKWRGLWTLLVSTGLRIGEALALQWSAVDLESETPTVSVSANLEMLTNNIVSPKTASSRRSVPLSPTAVDSLRQHRHLQNQRRIQNATAWQQDLEFVFTNDAGQHLTQAIVHERFKVHLTRAGCPNVRLHDLRHTFATLCLEGGANPKVVQQWMGHSSVAITMDTYSHVTPAMSLLVASIMEDVLSAELPPQSDAADTNVVQIDVKVGRRA
jgi:integrase